MAQLLHQLVLLASLLLCYFQCELTLGIAVLPEGRRYMDQIDSPVDANNLFRTEDGRMVEMFPTPESTHLEYSNVTRRRLGDFLGCGFCKCCDATQTYCEAGIPCCYSINCNVQPFGFCKFVPVSCNCRGCGL